MTIAVMQPYVFPYIGYFQLINAVDKFVFYDDVSFIKQGWINRNKILVSGKEFLFTVPLEKASSFNFIKDTKINRAMYIQWMNKFILTIDQNYSKAPYADNIKVLLQEILSSEFSSISDLAIETIVRISAYLDIKTEFVRSSETYNNKDIDRQQRLIDICKKENADHYINALGGQELYQKEDFSKEGIKLNFIKSKPIVYQQLKNEFVPWLSIIDVLMFNNKKEIHELLNQYELI